tara:strand:+ start:3315 stop:4238 length:924 start_codon:yes stop_codon:yes gene_type:complete
MKKIINNIFIIFFLFCTTESIAKINNSIIISVGNLPITRLDLIKEMTLISILTKNKINNSNKETIKSIAVQSLIKRKVKEIEIKKFGIDTYNKKDLDRMILNASINAGTDKNGLRNIIEENNLNFENVKKRFEIDLKWNTLIFQLYKNKVVLNTSEIENKISSEIQKTQSKKLFLLSEIEVNQSEKNHIILKNIFDSIKNEGFENTAKKFSISKSAEYGGNIGWVDQKDLSKNIYENIASLKTDQISKPIYFDNTIVIIKKVGEKVFEKDINKIKDKVVRMEKEKKLQMFSKAHYANLEKIIQVNFL